MRWRTVTLWASLIAMACAAVAEEGCKPAQLDVSGLGLFGNRVMRRTLTTLLLEGKKPEVLDSSFVEDAALIIVSQLGSQGFLHPQVAAVLTLDDERTLTFLWDEPNEAPLPNDLRIRRAEFNVRRGIRSHYESLRFSGLNSMKGKDARAFFIETGALLKLKRYRIYTPERFKRGLRNLVESLRRQGFNEASATVEALHENPSNGNVHATIQIREGPKYTVRELFETVATNATNTVFVNKPYSAIVEQDYAQQIRSNYFSLGYPDVAVQISTTNRTVQTNAVALDLVASVSPGPAIKVADVRFEGLQRSSRSLLEKRVPLEAGEPLDRVQAERGRLRISRLGIFESVELMYEPVNEMSRAITYRVKEGKRIDVNLLVGYGSYELGRGGFEVEQFNVFGRAHHSRLRAVQSFKSSSGLYTYTMPELLGEDWDVFLRGFGLRREEVSFTRVEYGGGAGVQRALRSLDSTVIVRYDYQVLNATETDVNLEPQGVESPGVGAITFDFRHDRRNNPLYPQRGYKVFTSLEWASELLASDVNYERFEVFGSYHWPVDDSRRIHLGLSHGFIASVGDASEDLPFTRRFFPGGENSLRGYQEGEAAPRDGEGDIIGAETYLFGSVEFEQGLTPQWALVVFADGLGTGPSLDDYPGRDFLFSVGAGVRWRTLIGPVRLEYGHNLNRRNGDPSGTLHFSLGFPF